MQFGQDSLELTSISFAPRTPLELNTLRYSQLPPDRFRDLNMAGPSASPGCPTMGVAMLNVAGGIVEADKTYLWRLCP